MSRLNLSPVSAPTRMSPNSTLLCLSVCLRSLHCAILFNRTRSSTCVDIVHPPCVMMRFIKSLRGVVCVGWGMTAECVERNCPVNSVLNKIVPYSLFWTKLSLTFCVERNYPVNSVLSENVPYILPTYGVLGTFFFFCVLQRAGFSVVTARLCGPRYAAERRNFAGTRSSSAHYVLCQRGFVVTLIWSCRDSAG